jgi:hypothetical protein|tara:strand:- start:1786 stop:2433 length:648 start_codon:yes stop_codon:yes gene_type:complete
MTYIDLVNNVLRRLRETEVTSVQSNLYSKLIGDLVNDAKDLVESAWDWSALRSTLTINTTSGTYNYALTGSQDKIKELSIINDTSNIVMEYKTTNWIDEQYFLQSPLSGAPKYYTYNGVNASGDALLDVYPNPDGVYALKVKGVFRNIALSSDVDKLDIPAMPVLHLAVAFAARERGETGGTSTSEYFQMANKYLSDAIALDAARHPEETIFYTP